MFQLCLSERFYITSDIVDLQTSASHLANDTPTFKYMNGYLVLNINLCFSTKKQNNRYI